MAAVDTPNMGIAMKKLLSAVAVIGFLSLSGYAIAGSLLGNDLTYFGIPGLVTKTAASVAAGDYIPVYDHTSTHVRKIDATKLPFVGATPGAGSFTTLATSSTSSLGDDVTIANGKSIKSDTTTAHTWLLQAYDNDDAVYRTFGTLTNGNTPSLALAAPSGGTLTVNKVTFTAPASAATLTLIDGTTVTGPATSGTIATQAGTQTLTNKTLTDFIDSGSVVSSAISATSGTTGTTLTNIPGLSVAVTAGKTYAFQARVTGTSTANSGVKLAFANSGSTTSANYTCIQNNGTTQNAHSSTTTMGNAVGAATTVFTDAQCWGVVVVNAAGNLTMQFAQNASHADTTTVDANGFMSVRRLN